MTGMAVGTGSAKNSFDLRVIEILQTHCVAGCLLCDRHVPHWEALAYGEGNDQKNREQL
jgi:hypothetical protein